MANIELIRKLDFKEGRSIRLLSKDLGLSRQTIRKALQQNEIPTYQRLKPVANPAIDPVKSIIIRWLVDDETAPVKQGHSAAQIHRRLEKEYESRTLLKMDWKTISSKKKPFYYYALRLRSDLQAIKNALLSPFSNGLLEGQINRLKTI